MIRRTLDKYQEVVGKPPRRAVVRHPGNGTHAGFPQGIRPESHSDYLNDDQPYLIDTIHGSIVCVPYSNDINDFNMFARAACPRVTASTCSSTASTSFTLKARQPTHHERRPAPACHRPASPGRRVCGSS